MPDPKASLLVESLLMRIPPLPKVGTYDPVRQLNVDEKGLPFIESPESAAYLKTKSQGGGSGED